VRREVMGAQNVSRMCMVCGIENTAGLKGRFFAVDGGDLVGVFKPLVEHQGYPGRMHGGLVSAILDETIGRAVSINEAQTWGVTIEFTIKFRAPVPLDREVKAIGRITRDSRRIFEGTGEIVLDDGTIAAEAQGKYMKMPIGEIASKDFSDDDWFADALPLPEQVDVGNEG
jgi:acyl-coenzyme A thioesterase PaaI-like protein